MKKLILMCYCLGLLTLTSCQQSTSTDTEEVQTNLNYFKDTTTNLCFASITSVNSYGSITSITCVPCDSIKNLK